MPESSKISTFSVKPMIDAATAPTWASYAVEFDGLKAQMELCPPSDGHAKRIERIVTVIRKARSAALALKVAP